jgi:hypothetical protein
MATTGIAQDATALQNQMRPRATKSTFARDCCVFLAGAQAFHTISHLLLGVSGSLPMELKYPPMTVTASMNAWAIAINAITTFALIYASRSLSR